MSESSLKADVVILGGGLAGLATALELLEETSLSVLVLDRDLPGRLGGLAAESFGGIFMVDTPVQRRGGIGDSVELALADWLRTADFAPGDEWPRRWAAHYVEQSLDLYHWLAERAVRFFPVVHWVERGLYEPGNSVPRFHMVWGTGRGLVDAIVGRIESHRHRDRLELRFRHDVQDLLVEGGRAVGCRGVDEATGLPFEARGERVVCATGGICGDLARVRREWDEAALGAPPEVLLNGSHRYADGQVIDRVAAAGGVVTHLDKMWNYAAGVRHPEPDRPDHGLSLVPPKSALWLDWRGRRIGPVPLVTAFDTRFLVESICRQERKYSWQVLNHRIAVKELAVSGSEYNDAIRDKKLFAFLKSVLLGNERLVADLSERCPDFVTASSVEELAGRMNALQGDESIDAAVLRQEIERYDAMVARGPRFHDDDQLRRIAHVRRYRGDRVRTCKPRPILDSRDGPLIAIREFILTRKSLGGIQTDLESRVLAADGQPIPGLYAVGEAAGFGGGGVHGLRALEGTFLGGCLITARSAAGSIRG